VLLAFGLALLCGLAFDALRERARLPRWILPAGAALALLAICAEAAPLPVGRLAVGFTRSQAELEGVAARDLPRALSEAGLFWIATLVGLELARSGGRPLSLAGLALLTAVPIAANRRIGWTFQQDDVFAPPTLVHFLRKHDPQGQYRTLGELLFRPVSALEVSESGSDVGLADVARRSWTLHTQVLWGRGTVFNADFDNGDLSRVQSLRKISAAAESFANAADFFGSFSLRWGTRYRDRVPVAGYRPIGGAGFDAWDENASALPDIRLASGWREEKDAVAALHRLSELSPGEVVVETGRSSRGAAPAGRVHVIEKNPERLVLETEAEAPCWLFVLRGFWRHRVVRLDGREVDVYPAQLAFSAIPIPPGRHRVEWEETFPGWSVSRFGPLLYAATILTLFAARRRAFFSPC
jgi:hypothetical protein